MQQRECGDGDEDFRGAEQSGTLLFSTFFCGNYRSKFLSVLFLLCFCLKCGFSLQENEPNCMLYTPTLADFEVCDFTHLHFNMLSFLGLSLLCSFLKGHVSLCPVIIVMYYYASDNLFI